jgi:AcrR family transcriptional regulator
MTEPRRRRATTEEKVTRVLDATEAILLSDGYAAASSRTVAAAAGINAPLLHYYFATIDDLFVAVLRRRAEHNVERMAKALASPRPLAAWWELVSDPRGARLFTELLAAANHRPPLAAEVGTYAREVRRMQMEALERLLPEYGLGKISPALIATAMQGIAFALVSDQAAGYDTRTDEAAVGMVEVIEMLESRRRRKRPARR